MKNLFAFLLVLPIYSLAQFKYDNTLYKTIYWEEFCRQIHQQKNALVLDVRSQGEYDDTSRSSSLNIGHLKGAKHINVTDLGARIHELDAYKDKPVYVYCSHSQRSRRSSKMLADSGFTKVYNINGGLTDLYFQNEIPCKSELVTSSTGYTQLNPLETYHLIQSQPSLQLIDVRSDSIFNGWSGNAKDRAMGKLKGSFNIPLSTLETSLARIEKTKPILFVDAGGDEAAKAARILVDKGYSNVMIAFNGLDAWLGLPEVDKQKISSVISRDIAYQTIDAPGFMEMASQNVAIVDVRKADEFSNTAQPPWRNRGHIKNAVNLPVETLADHYALVPKDKPVIVYSFSNTPESYEAAELLSSKGFRNIYVLTPGLWGMRYKAYNMPNSSHFNDWVVDIPEENL